MPSSSNKLSVAAADSLIVALRAEALRRKMQNLHSQTSIVPATLTELVEMALQQRKALFDQNPSQLTPPSQLDGKSKVSTVKVDLALAAGVDAEYQYWRDRGLAVLRRDIVSQALHEYIVLNNISMLGT